ncbi:invasion associated locus B family protein [Rhizobium sp. BK376]|uniref:invasion associated locus B family protein n=1 Tax=Rhizobium sp. BK376 TaxID=2512149 RepID=UPI0010D80468|nr:invasion associated locus B family protein [Rhizobium sp. BK376]TCR83871.1 hypothetical protein EV561_10895 [Rhizobium sp. BK376]
MSVKPIAIAFSLLLSSASIAAAAQPTRINEFDDWGVYSYASKQGTVCYALSMPKQMKPEGIDHGRNFFIVSPGGDGGSAYVPEAIMGYPLKAGSAVNITIGDDKFVMFTKDNAAWVQKEGEEPQMVSAMQGGSDMLVEATSKRGTSTSYSYSLSGITAALKQVAKCN